MGHQAATEHHAVTDVVAVGPGALGVANGVQQGAPLRRDRVEPGGRRGQKHLGQPAALPIQSASLLRRALDLKRVAAEHGS